MGRLDLRLKLTAEQTMQKITGSERSGDQRGDPSTVGGLDAHMIANMYKNIGVAH